MANRDGRVPTLEEAQRLLDSAWQQMDLRGRAPFEGIEGSIGCMRCGESFSMTLGSVMPFTHSSGSQGFLCLPCLEKLNQVRVSVQLNAFPVQLVGYRGRALSSAPVPLSTAQWAMAVDGRELLRFAAPRIPPQHLGLVLASLAASSWRHLHAFAPGDPRPALAIAALRAWCHGEATVAELASAIEGVKQTSRAIDQRSNPAPKHAVMAIWNALEAAISSAEGRSEIPARAAGLVRAVSSVVESVVCAEVEDANARGLITRATREQQLQSTATLIRRQLPWPAVASNRWEATPGLAVSGAAVLRLDGWEIGDAVTIEEFKTMSGPRAVAFDAAQLGRSDHLGSPWPSEAAKAPDTAPPPPLPQPTRRWWQTSPESEARGEEALEPLRRLCRGVDRFFETLMRVLFISVGVLILVALLVDGLRGNERAAPRRTSHNQRGRP